MQTFVWLPRESDALELELQVFVSRPLWVLGAKLQSWKSSNPWAVLPTPFHFWPTYWNSPLLVTTHFSVALLPTCFLLPLGNVKFFRRVSSCFSPSLRTGRTIPAWGPMIAQYPSNRGSRGGGYCIPHSVVLVGAPLVIQLPPSLWQSGNNCLLGCSGLEVPWTVPSLEHGISETHSVFLIRQYSIAK